MRYGDEGFRKFNMVNNINYDINNWMHVSMKTSYIRTELDGLAQMPCTESHGSVTTHNLSCL